ncbi:MAG: MmcQ/YjbR family DNA-binding protein [Erysipelotrichaceae bacterium]|nr:MmcQ/YjbR family DNA-binding protein [Erysipelotrichaceae bacterium]
MSNISIEERVFQFRRFMPEAMRSFGFSECNGSFSYETPIMDGIFTVSVTVTNGTLKGTVLDSQSGEEYILLKVRSADGNYVTKVREEYEKVLNEIAVKCCRQVLFASDQGNRIAGLISDRYHVEPDFPWSDEKYRSAAVFRHHDNNKWFGLLMNIKRNSLLKDGSDVHADVMNLKASPDDMVHLTAINGIYPAYHMNHKYWISVILDDRLDDETVMKLINDSFLLTQKKTK